MELRKVLITGASGFIGSALLESYRVQGREVVGLDLQADAARGILEADLTRPGPWHSALQGVDLVIHTAAIVSNTASMEQAWRVNVKSTADLLEACVDAGVQRFVQLSSIAAFGFDFDEDVDEGRPLRPMGNTYVDTKIASEHIVLACHGSGAIDCTIVRPADVYGPGSRPWVIIPLQMLAAGRFLLPAHGRGIFSPVYVDDLVNGIVLAAASPAGAGQIFTIGGGPGVPCDEFFGYHARMLDRGRPVPAVSTRTALLIAETARRVYSALGQPTELGRGTIDMLSRRAGYSIDKARDVLGYAPQFDLERGMQITADWVRREGIVA